MTILAAAEALVKRGVSVLPTDKKRPTCKWEPFQVNPPALCDLEVLFKDVTSLGIICGAVSGNLECIDFDDLEAYPKWREVLVEHGYEELLSRLTIQSTPSGGMHVVYRCETPVQGNLKLAQAEDLTVMVETRGDHGYFCAYPSPGYKMVQGTWAKLPKITAEERDALLSAARFLTRREPAPITHRAGPSDICRPGDEYAAKHSWADILEPLGWKHSHRRGDEDFWIRPGKDKRGGPGATTNYKGSDVLKVFTSNGGRLEPDRTYTKFAVYAEMYHGGNMREAARALAAAQWRPPARKISHPLDREYTDLSYEDARPKQKWKRASEFETKVTEWLVEPIIPLGEITLVAGDPGDGKSTLCQAIVTHVTLGTPIQGVPVVQGEAIFMSAEQSVETVTKPRFIAMGADLERIILPDEVDEDDRPVPFILDKAGLAELREQVMALRPKVVVVDTITAYIEAARDFNTANSVREWMRGLAEIARAANCAILAVTHCNKATGQKAIYRIMGSVDFVGASRSVLMVGKDPDDEDTKAAAHIKSNVGPLGKPVGYSIKDGIFGWVADVELTADRMMEPAQSREAKNRAERCSKWLVEYLEAPQLSEDVFAEAKLQGFSRNACFEAKVKIGAVAKKEGFGKESHTCWFMPESKDNGPWWNRE